MGCHDAARDGVVVSLISGVGRAEHREVIERDEEADERDEQSGCVGSAVHLVVTGRATVSGRLAVGVGSVLGLGLLG